ncbi:alpha/beta fold hydrolase [Nocardia sp. NPDC051570]|uniref:alpha/beta fold hydrolase n=1 Tax=Nocardia sp. NPDC051570 TaxID=3364324 RepID=UPI0037ABA464
MTTSTTPLRPFQRMAFDALPERPVRPHPYFDSEAHEVHMDSATLGRLRIHYREYGSGTPLLLVHGLMTSSYSWRYLLNGLGQRYRLIVPDLPGAGASSAPPRRLTAAALSAWIGEFQTLLGLHGCPVVGNSLGGYLAMRHALTDPAAFGAVINIHSPAIPLPRLHLLHAALSLPGANSLLQWWIRRDTARWAHRTVHYYDETLKSLEEARQYGDALATADGAATFIDYLHGVMAPASFAGFSAELRRRHNDGKPFPAPLLLIYSRQDPLVPPAVGARLSALLPQAEFHWLDRSSHFAHADTPTAVIELALPFLRNHR